MKPASTLPRFLLPLLLCLVTVTVGGDDSPATASSIRVNGSANGAVSPAGDVDYWRVNVPSAGQLVVETTGDTDTTGALEDRDGNLLQEHDDQDVNTNRNFKIERAVTASVYYIRISAYRNSTGDYTLRVRHTPESGGGAGGGDMGPAGARVAVSHALGDLNGDGNDDVLLRHTDGRWLYYPMNGREYLAGRRATANLTRDLNRRVVTGTNATQGNQGGGNDDGDTDTGAPDLVVESPSVSDSTLAPGDTFSLNVRVRNQGDARSGSTTLRYYRSTNSTVNSSDTQVGADSVAGLSGGGNRSISETLVAPSGPGTYYYGACVDSVNGESNAGNNCSRGIRVRVEAEQTPGAPDLIVELTGSYTATPGESLLAQPIVRNQGTAAASGTILRFYRSLDQRISSADTQIDTASVPSLAEPDVTIGLDSFIAVFSSSAPSSPGAYYYGACVDPVSGESDTGNNCSSSVRVTVSSGDTGGGDDHSNTRSGATSLSPNSSRAGRIDPGNDTDYFTVRLIEAGTLTTYTTGNLDTAGELQSSSGSRLDSNDDSGSGLNFRIERALSAGTYYIKVESYRTSTGSYTLHADFSASGGDRNPAASGLSVSLRGACSDTIHLRFFEGRDDVTSSSAQWPGGGRVYVVREGERYQQSLGCTPGHKVCYGARNTSTNSYWGVDIDASEGCEGCCQRCPTSGGRENSGVRSHNAQENGTRFVFPGRLTGFPAGAKRQRCPFYLSLFASGTRVQATSEEGVQATPVTHHL